MKFLSILSVSCLLVFALGCAGRNLKEEPIDVQAKNAIIGGRIEGKIKVEEKLVLETKSKLVGELKANKLIIDEGAIFEGTSNMGVQADVKPDQPKPMAPKPG